MLDVKITGYVVPVAEQPQASLTPVISVVNLADEGAVITGLIRIYRESTGLLTYSSELAVTQLAHHSTASIAALTPFDPGAPADDDYFIKADITATSYLPGPPTHDSLGAWYFDIKPVPMGPLPATHHTTHENGGMDPVDLTGMTGLTGTPQTPATHATTHEPGGSDPISLSTCRSVGEASNATPTPDADTTDLYYLSALGVDATFGAPTGIPVDGQKLIVRILDDATPRNLAWNAGAGGYIAHGATLPVITTASKYLYVGLIYNETLDLWCCVAVSEEA